MKSLIFILIAASVLCSAEKFERFYISKGTVGNAVKALNEVSELSIIYTKAAAAVDAPSMTLKKKNSLQILKVICRVANIAYIYDSDLDVYTLKTLEEYRDQLSFTDNEKTRQFHIEPLNLKSLGVGLEDLYGDRLYLSYGLEVEQESLRVSSLDGTSNNNSNSNNNLSNNNNSNSNNNLSNNNNSNSNNSRSGRRSKSKAGGKRFNKDFTHSMNIELEKLTSSIVALERQAVIDNYINKIRQDEPLISVTLNQEHSRIIVRTADTKAMKEIAEYIEANDKKIPQVLLEMKILELTINDDFNSVFDISLKDPGGNKGTNLGGTSEDFLNLNPGNILGIDGQSFTRAQSTLAYEYLGKKVAARIELLKQDNLVETLATPILIATNNREGEIKIVSNEVFVENFEYQEARINETTGAITQPAQLTTEIRQEDVGLTLRIKPQINDDNTLSLTVFQEDSSKITNGAKVPVSINGALQDQFIDIKSEKSIHSTVIAKDKTVIAIGGLVRTENVTSISKVPILGDIPLLGYFFRSEKTENVKKELVLLITPHIMYSSQQSVKKSSDVLKKISDHKFHEGGQKSIDSKSSNLREYKNSKPKSIRDFVKDPEGYIQEK
jgi:type II secretory pathway component GspD/PulD (secretin)